MTWDALETAGADLLRRHGPSALRTVLDHALDAWAAERRGSYRFLTEQPMYSIFTRKPEGSVLPTAQRYGLGVLTFSPLNGGWLGLGGLRGRRGGAIRAG